MLLLAVAGVLSAALWVIRWDTTTQRAYPDSYWYVKQAATISGMPNDEAKVFAARTICQRGQPNEPTLGWPNCREGIVSYADSFPERYNRILDTRPGYPLFAAPFVLLFGESGMTLATLVLGVISGMAMAFAVRLLGGNWIQSLAAVVLLYLLPTGFWMTRLLGEGGALAATLVTLCAATALLRATSTRARWVSAGLTGAGLLVTTLMRPANGALLGAALAGVALVIGFVALIRRRRPEARVLTLLGVSVGVVLLWQVIGMLLNLPGMGETLQDKYTKHFTLPDVPDPWHRLWEQNREFWPSVLKVWMNGDGAITASPMLAILFGGVFVLFRALPWRDALLWFAAGATAFAALLAHPIWTEADRLLIFAWPPLALGLAMVLRRRSAAQGQPDSLEPSESEADRPALPRQRTPRPETAEQPVTH
jgi:hypothetical protein